MKTGTRRTSTTGRKEDKKDTGTQPNGQGSNETKDHKTTKTPENHTSKKCSTGNSTKLTHRT
eukprot:12519562-Prorocentrum_lima.AAC.1